MSEQYFSRKLLDWFRQNGRHNLPWQRNSNPYRVWIAEIMLQQTQANTVIPYYIRFVDRFPDLQSLAWANIDEVLGLWAGLGYYARARNLHRAARLICEHHHGLMPREQKLLQALPGIGRSTAGAILALAYGQRQTILEGNVKRVLTRYYAISGWPGSTKIGRQLWQLAERLTPTKHIRQYTQAIMDLGATVCTRSQPQCDLCPVAKRCVARQTRKIHELPTPRPKKSLPLHSKMFLIIRNKREELLFEQRPPVGIWGGLWSFPECPLEENVDDWLQTKLGLRASLTQKLALMQHTFTHFKLRIYPIYLQVQYQDMVRSDRYHWHSLQQELQFGVPAPIKKLMGQLVRIEQVISVNSA